MGKTGKHCCLAFTYDFLQQYYARSVFDIKLLKSLYSAIGFSLRKLYHEISILTLSLRKESDAGVQKPPRICGKR